MHRPQALFLLSKHPGCRWHGRGQGFESPKLHPSPIRLSQGGTPTTARESGGCHSDFTALLVPPGVPPAVQTVQTGPIRRGSQMVNVEAGQGPG
jgi:hypothetical protein